MMKITLHRPISQGPQVFTTVTLREPTARELARISARVPANNFDAARDVIAMLTGLDPVAVEGLCARDFFQLSEAAAEIFREMEQG